MWLLCVWVPSLRELMSSIMRWRSGLIASVLIGNSCLRSGLRDPDLQDRMTHTLLTISPRVEPYWYAPRPPPRAIAQRFSALAPLRHADRIALCPSSIPKRKWGGHRLPVAIDPQRKSF